MGEDIGADVGYVCHPGDVVCFGDAHPVLAIRHDGEPWPWLLDLDHEHHAGQGCCRAVAPEHEQLGRLPDIIRKRVHGECWAASCTRPAEHRGAWCWRCALSACQATTTVGRPCRNQAEHDGSGELWCHVHRGRQ